jgi:pimeloyl-ACP methyl ester carboxylesterase
VADHLARLIPGAQRAIVRGGTHAFAHEHPAETAAAIRAHLTA